MASILISTSSFHHKDGVRYYEAKLVFGCLFLSSAPLVFSVCVSRSYFPLVSTSRHLWGRWHLRRGSFPFCCSVLRFRSSFPLLLSVPQTFPFLRRFSFPFLFSVRIFRSSSAPLFRSCFPLVSTSRHFWGRWGFPKRR